MSFQIRQVPLPQMFDARPVVTCDGCGLETPGGVENLGWMRQSTPIADGVGGIDRDNARADFCPDCTPKVQAAQKVEADSIKAEKLAAQAAAVGVPS